jgi:hypothetical protein
LSATGRAPRLQSGDDNDVVQVLVSGCIVGATTSDQSQAGIVSWARAKVIPLCMDLPTSDLTGPLKTFQGRCLDLADMKRLVHDLDKDAEKQPGKERLDKIFNREWPRVEGRYRSSA